MDRSRAEERSREVTRIMAGVSFSPAAVALPLFCFQIAMQNVSEEEQRELGNVVNRLRADANPEVTDQLKAFALGAALLTVVGKAVLDRAVQDLGSAIRP